ncbi:MAG: carboxypeptidase regulatory-like domain-containing protein, partial [Bryobacteraceae bacterium]
MVKLLCLGLGLTAGLLAQTAGTISGQITDQSHAAIALAEVTATAVDTGVATKVATDHEGNYTILGLPPARYVITATVDGFKKATSKPVQLDSISSVKVNLVMAPSDSKVVVEVQADPPAIETQSGMIGTTMTSLEIEALPISGRNALEMAMTIPGVGGDIGSDEGGIFQDVPSAGSGISVSGGRAGSTAIMSDGTSATSVGMGRATVTFSPETIQEIQIITSTFSAKYGVSGGGVINTVSRAGTNQFRGTAYWFNRNPLFEAHRFGRPIPAQEKRNEVGLTYSGPVVIPKLYNGKRRTFFFVGIEPKRWFDAVDIYARFPTAEERAGDLRNSYVAPGARRNLLYRQMRCMPAPQDCQFLMPQNRPSGTAEYPLFSNNDPDPSKRGLVIPKAYISPAALKILEDVPLPNQDYDSAGRNYFGSRGVNGASNRVNVKVDHNFTAKNRFSGRYVAVPNLADRYQVNKENLFFG